MQNRFFQYPLNPNNNQPISQIVTLNPAQADGLIKSLSTILSLSQPAKIYMTDSRLCHWLHDGAGILYIDLQDLLKAKISIGLIRHRGIKRKLQSLNNGADLSISCVHDGQFYRFVAGPIEVDLPAVSFEDLKEPILNLNNAAELGTEIQIEDTTLLSQKAKAGSVRILVYSGQLSALWFCDGSTYQFSPLALCECPSPSDQMFRSFAFLRCTGKKAEIKLLKNGDGHYLITDSTISIGISAQVIEPLFTII